MARAVIKAEFPRDVRTVWDIVTSLENYAWRSDLDTITVLSDDQFVERAKGGVETVFTVTCREECSRWEFDIDNANIKGHWTGLFTFRNGVTEIEFTESAVAKNPLMKPIVGLFLKKQQAVYLRDLERAVRSAAHMEKQRFLSAD